MDEIREELTGWQLNISQSGHLPLVVDDITGHTIQSIMCLHPMISRSLVCPGVR